MKQPSDVVDLIGVFYFMETSIEIWKDVPGYEGFYQCSNFGNVKSLDRVVKRNNNNKRVIGKQLKKCINCHGYYVVVLCKKSILKSFTVHQLVAMCFLGHKRNGNTLVINHIDGNKINNMLSNIEIVTNRQNSSTCFRKNSEFFTSKYIGVYWKKGRRNYSSAIEINGKKIHLGTFKTEIDASIAYQNKLNEITL